MFSVVFVFDKLTRVLRITRVTEESTAVVDKNLTVEKQDGEGEATDAKNETPAEKAEEKPEDKVQYYLLNSYLFILTA